MAYINANEVDIGMVVGATWGTAVDLTTAGRLIHCSSFDDSAIYETLKVNDAGFDNFDTKPRDPLVIQEGFLQSRSVPFRPP